MRSCLRVELKVGSPAIIDFAVAWSDDFASDALRKSAVPESCAPPSAIACWQNARGIEAATFTPTKIADDFIDSHFRQKMCAVI
jgi:hypothetical protein